VTDRIDYQSVLNPSQYEAVMTLEGPVIVIAGAGSGKTRTLVYRVARLVETGVPPESILLLTFTRKASQEMLERASGLADARCRFVSGGTFHSLAYRVLRSRAQLLGYENSFIILDRSDMEEVIQSLIPELGLPKNGGGRIPKRSTLANILSKAANLEQSTERLMEEEYGQFLEFLPHVRTLSGLYKSYKKTHHMMDYDDLILNLRQLLVENEAVREDLGGQYRYIMVDEYQDTNSIQADIVKGIGEEHRNVMVVGDDSQAIYSFRGANYKNMFEFPRKFPGAKMIKLEENYRSTQPILTLTNAMMAQAAERYTKCLFTKRSEGETPLVVDTRTEPEQGRFIVRTIKEQMGHHRSLNDFAVLFRAGFHSFELEMELARQGIPFVKYGGFKFMESAHIKDFLAHLRVVVHRGDAVSWGRVLRLVNFIGHAKSTAIMRWMQENQAAPGDLGNWPGSGKGGKGLQSLGRLLSDLSGEGSSPKGAVSKVMKYYTPILEEKYDDYPRRQKELEQLIPMAARYRSLRSFLDDLVLDPPDSGDADPDKKGEYLTLSTVHSAKGLEWPVVFIIWVMEGRFPPGRAYSDPASIEEERRLMYVAATRAKDRLIMCYPSRESMPLWSAPGGGRSGLSCFIEALPPDTVTRESVGVGGGLFHSRRPFPSPAKGCESVSRGSHRLSPGDRVRHPAFGRGVVSKLIGEDKAEIFFQDAGRKLLHLEFTMLEKI
jgi:DNA helicase II / ATP-dependent DNA helicase PcrA